MQQAAEVVTKLLGVCHIPLNVLFLLISFSGDIYHISPPVHDEVAKAVAQLVAGTYLK